LSARMFFAVGHGAIFDSVGSAPRRRCRP
jgi:hypothetical protein